MVLVPGVQVEQLGKLKSGPDSDSRFMSRREYVQLVEAEDQKISVSFSVDRQKLRMYCCGMSKDFSCDKRWTFSPTNSAMEIMNYHKTFLDLSFAEVPTMRRSQSLPPATFWAASRADFSKTAYAESLMCRAAEAFSWPVHVNENLGSLGHPEICGSPCIRFYYGSCKKGMDCQFCHLEHEASKKKLDKMQRHCFESMTEAQAPRKQMLRLNSRRQSSQGTESCFAAAHCLAAMYGGVGIMTPKGSGTNGYVQRNLSFLPRQRLDFQAQIGQSFKSMTGENAIKAVQGGGG
eukprot:g28318.t2